MYKVAVTGVEELRHNFKVLSGPVPDSVAYKGSAASGLLLEGRAKRYIGGPKAAGVDKKGVAHGAGTPLDGFQLRAAAKAGTTEPGEFKLHRRSGALANSITSLVGVEDGMIGVAVGTDIVYGRIHEVGGTINRIGKKSGKPYTITMPTRPYLLAALFAVKTSVERLFTKIFWDETRKGMK